MVWSVNAACNAYRPEPELDPMVMSEPTQIAGTPLSRIWSRRVVVRSPSDPIAIDSMSLFVGGSDHKVAAVDIATGRNRWVIRLSGPVTAGILRSGTLVFAVTDQPEGKVHALTPTAGNEVWSTGTGYVDVPLTIIDDHLYVMNRIGVLHALDPETGKRLWHRKLERGRIPPIPADSSHLLVTTLDSLYIVARQTGIVANRLRSPGVVVTPWLVWGEELLAGTADSAVLAVDRTTFAVRWRAKVDAPVLASPVLRGDTLLVVTRVGTVYRKILVGTTELERVTALNWPVTADPIMMGDWLLVGGADGALRAFTPDGTEAWQVNLGRPVEVRPLFEGATLIGVGGKGQISRYQM